MAAETFRFKLVIIRLGYDRGGVAATTIVLKHRGHNGPVRYLLFDIDGTLISTGRAGSRGMLAAIREVTGLESLNSTDFHGRTDSHLLPELLRANGLTPTEELVQKAKLSYFGHLSHALDECEGMVLPGIQTLLDRLSGEADFSVGLRTGNFPVSAEMKLSHYGIWNHFRYGFYGDISPQRNDLSRQAWEELSKSEPDLHPSDIWIIGDTPLDVACAKEINARCLAVCTGGCNSEELTEAGADFVVKDCEDIDQVFQILSS